MVKLRLVNGGGIFSRKLETLGTFEDEEAARQYVKQRFPMAYGTWHANHLHLDSNRYFTVLNDGVESSLTFD